MQKPDSPPPKLVAIVSVIALLLASGGIGFYYASLSDTENTPDNGISEEALEHIPPGYYTDRINLQVATSLHRRTLNQTSYSYEYNYVVGTTQTDTLSQSVKLSVKESGHVIGTEITYEGTEPKEVKSVQSSDGVLYVVTKNGTETGTFANRNYANGLNVIQQGLSLENASLVRTINESGTYEYQYTLRSNNSSETANLRVREDGEIMYMKLRYPEGNTIIREEVIISEN